MFTFDGLRRIVWIAPLAETAAYSAGELCRRHAERFTAPRHWELRDLRPSAIGSTAPAGAAAPSRYIAPPEAPTLPFERPAARRAPKPLLGQRADRTRERDEAPAASSPLLARAFRNAG